ncbi:serine hydrolase [Streptomyces sp. CC224B]|uniref:serine hydrolase n=1 Tax=Streptomyces sp. CC224B TaxID=3044571 RepID=UPI0024A9D50F|nr:serine hydrolase [Streptomyces sp. CC224B]
MISRRVWLSAAVLALAMSSLPSAAVSAAPRPSDTGWSVQRDADALRDTGVTGVAVRLETPRGTTTASSGAGDLVTHRPAANDGSMTGTARDLNRFFTALAKGRLLRPAELTAMRTTVPVPRDSGHPTGTRDGLGLFLTPLSCGGGYLGHGGSGFGYVIRTATTTDGRRTITVSAHSRSADQQVAAHQEDALRDLIDHALCRT